jgi:hypothetical protein
LKKAVDKVLKMPDLQHIASGLVFEKKAKKCYLNVKVPPNNLGYWKVVALYVARQVYHSLLANHKKVALGRDGFLEHLKWYC